MSSNDWKRAEQIIGVCLKVVKPMNYGCWLCTDSGGVKRYVVGRLDNGDVFVEKCSPNFW